MFTITTTLLLAASLGFGQAPARESLELGPQPWNESVVSATIDQGQVWGHVGLISRAAGLEIDVFLTGLEADETHTLMLDGIVVVESTSDAFGVLRGQWFIDHDLRLAKVSTVEIGSSTRAGVVTGGFESLSFAEAQVSVYREDIGLEPMETSARGWASVRREPDGSQRIESKLIGLEPTTSYTVLLDGLEIATVISNRVGQATLELSDPSFGAQLPPELTPVENILTLDWVAKSGQASMHGSFSGHGEYELRIHGTVAEVDGTDILSTDGDIVRSTEETLFRGFASLDELVAGDEFAAQGDLEGEILIANVIVKRNADSRPAVRGEVLAVAASSFDIATPHGPATVLVDEATEWHGELSGLGDIEVGQHVVARGEWIGEGQLAAEMVAPAPPHGGQGDLRLVGKVSEIGTESFSLTGPDGQQASIRVDERTQWGDGLDGLASLQIDMAVHVGAVRTDDGLYARFVGPAQPHGPMRLHGEITAISGDSFTLVEGEASANVLTNGETQYGGELTGFADLEIGMRVIVHGDFDAAGNFIARGIAEEGSDGGPHPQPQHLRGEITEISGSSFTLVEGDHNANVLINDQTQYGEGLDGFNDLQVGMRVDVVGEFDEDRNFIARGIAIEGSGGGPHPQPQHLRGEITEISGNSFTLVEGDHSANVLVNDQTQYGEGLDGFDDLQVGMRVDVVGEFDAAGNFIARGIAIEDSGGGGGGGGGEPHPRVMGGEVTAIGDSAFELSSNDGTHTINVDDNTHWMGRLNSFADLAVGDHVRCEIVPRDDQSLYALSVGAQHHD